MKLLLVALLATLAVSGIDKSALILKVIDMFLLSSSRKLWSRRK